MTEPLTTELGVDRIDGEFHYALLAEKNPRALDRYDIFNIYRKDDDGSVANTLRETVLGVMQEKDEQARHHREAERQKINEAAAKLANRAGESRWAKPGVMDGYLWATLKFDCAEDDTDAGFTTFLEALEAAAALTQASTRGEGNG